MRIAELSRRTGVSIPTIKFYIRAGALAPGRHTARNQARYGVTHVERLQLIRALRDDARLGVAAIARTLIAADQAGDRYVGAAIDAVTRHAGATGRVPSRPYREARRVLRRLSARFGWRLEPGAVSLDDAARAWAVASRWFPDLDPRDVLGAYARTAHAMARHEIRTARPAAASRTAVLRFAVLGTVLFEPLVLAMRRMANAGRFRALHHARRRPAGARIRPRRQARPPRT